MRKVKNYISIVFIILFTMILLSNLNQNVFADAGEYDPNAIYTYTTNVNNPVTINGLISEVGLHVYDNGNVDELVDAITLYDGEDYYANVLNQPNAMARKLGSYDVVFRCSDPYSNYVNCTIRVKVVDTTAPVIDADASKLALIFKKSEINNNTMNIIKNGIVAKDNHDTELTKQFGETSFDLQTSIGTFTVPFLVIDKSNNRATVNIDIEIIDEIGPKFHASTTYIKLNMTDRAKTWGELSDMFELTAYDEETQQNCAISVFTDEYTDNYNKPGVYKIVVIAKDTNNNAVNVNCYVEVVDNVNPTIYLDNNKVTITSKVMFTMEDAKNIIRARKLVKNDNFELSLVSDEYSANYDNIGCYKYLVKATYEDNTYSLVELLLEVKEEVKEVIDDVVIKPVKEKLSFIKRVGSFFKKTATFTWNIIKWPVNKMIDFANKIFKK